MIEGYRKYYKPQKRYHTGLPKKIIENAKDNKVAITEPFTDFGTFSLVHQYLKFYLIKHIFKEMKISLLILGIFGFVPSCAFICESVLSERVSEPLKLCFAILLWWALTQGIFYKLCQNFGFVINGWWVRTDSVAPNSNPNPLVNKMILY